MARHHFVACSMHSSPEVGSNRRCFVVKDKAYHEHQTHPTHLVAATLVAFAQPTQAVVITADPDDVAAGALLNTAYPGVTLSASGVLVDNGSFDPDIYSTEIASVHPALVASTGTRVFNLNPVTFFPCDWLLLELRADFSTPTDFVSLDYIGFVDPAIPGSEDIGKGVLKAYDAADTLIAQANTADLLFNDVETRSISRLTNDIAYITAHMQGIDTPALTDRLVYNAVPLPGAAWSLGSGLAPLTAWARRRRNLARQSLETD